jgi:hypothetical protein
MSLRFSPNGNYLAVMYNRGGSSVGTSVSNSAVVIYTRQENGSWLHTHSSGTNITIQGTPDGMEWSSDNSAIYVLQSGTGSTRSLQIWGALAGTSSLQYTNASGYVQAYTKYPNSPSYNSPQQSYTMVAGGGYSATVGDSTGSSVGYVIQAVVPVSGHHDLVVVGGTEQTTWSATVAGLSTAKATSNIVVGSAGTAPNYVNTIADNISVDTGTVVQLSGAVLESGERIYVEAADSNAADIVAYGVEIS